MLFLDARHLFRQVDRAHRVFTPDQIEFLAQYRPPLARRTTENERVAPRVWRQRFADSAYRDVPGLCRVATRAEIAAQDWSLNPGRYVGVAPGEVVEDEDSG